METRILSAKAGIVEGAKIIKSGGIVAFPTETVYGLGADATNITAVMSIFTAKGRPQDNPLIVHIDSIDKLDSIAYDNDGLAKKLFSIFAPGPLTIIIPKKDIIPDIVTSGLPNVAVRIPSHQVARDFICACGCPIAAPSANTSSRPSPTEAKYVYEDLNGKIPLIIDGGASEVGIESTVLSLAGEIPVILRPGAITLDMLVPYISNIGNFEGKVLRAEAPGMKYKHYAPSCDMILADNVEYVLESYRNAVKMGMVPIILALGNNSMQYKGLNYINLGENANEVARNIYTAIREAEKSSNFIICEAVKNVGLGASIMNRLEKATCKEEK